MNDRHVSLLALGAFLVVVMLLASPYVVARLKPIPELPATGVTDEASATEPEHGDPNTLKIDSLGIVAPVQYVDEQSEAVYQEALREGVVHYPGTALPGQFGNVYIFGHSSDYVWSNGKYKTVFARLPQIEEGADIQITDADGQVFHYTVFETQVVGPRDLSVLDQFNNEKQYLTLQTSYPLGTALQRYIVVAELKVD